MSIDSLSKMIVIDDNSANQRVDRFLRKYLKQYPQIGLAQIFRAVRKGDIKAMRQQAASDKLQRLKEDDKLLVGDQITFSEVFREMVGKQDFKKRVKNSELRVKSLSAGRQDAEWRTHHSPFTIHHLKYTVEDFRSWIIDEDDEWLVISKPAGISIHPSQNDKTFDSLHDLIKQFFAQRGYSGTTFTPNVAYRLDKDTSWLVIIAKTYAWLQHLNEQIRTRQIDKEYYAITCGNFPAVLECREPMKKVVDKKFGRGKMVVIDAATTGIKEWEDAHTTGYKEKTWYDHDLGQMSLVRLKLHTGRMHQIRVHCAYHKYPVLGDTVYGVASLARKMEKKYGFMRQLLHCSTYSFVDMHGKKRSWTAPMPDDFQKVMKTK